MSTNINTNKNRPAYCVNRAKRRGTGSRGSTSSRAGKQRRQTDRHSSPFGLVSCRRTCCALMYAKFYVDKVINDNICIVFHVMFPSPFHSHSLSLSICQPVSLWCPDISDKSLQKLPFDNFAKANKFLGFWLVVRTQWEILPNLMRFARWPLASLTHSLSLSLSLDFHTILLSAAQISRVLLPLCLSPKQTAANK